MRDEMDLLQFDERQRLDDTCALPRRRVASNAASFVGVRCPGVLFCGAASLPRPWAMLATEPIDSASAGACSSGPPGTRRVTVKITNVIPNRVGISSNKRRRM